MGSCYCFDRLLWGQRWFAGPLVIVGVGIGFNWFTCGIVIGICNNVAFLVSFVGEGLRGFAASLH